jgi:hypothetical protein
MSIRE